VVKLKVWLTKTANNKLWPCDDLAENKLKKIAVGENFEWSVNTSQNGKLHRKIFAFFAFCTKYYYGDIEASKDEYCVEFVRKRLTVFAGYYRQVWTRDGDKFELVALSLSYDKMSPEERCEFYNKIVNAALKHVFDRTNDEDILNELINWF
jgi:hypothetical protein